MIDAVLLGILQGFTEFLPVSSSGHLVLAQRLLGVEFPGITFEVAVHLGTLGAVLIVYGRDLLNIAGGVFGLGAPEETRRARHLALFLAVGSIPAAIAGIGLKGTFESLFGSIAAVGVSLLITGIVLRSAGSRVHGRRSAPQLGLTGCLVVGLAQALAIAPGISRSGATVSIGMTLGLRPDEAARFSFLLSVPAVAGAGLVDLLDASWDVLSGSVLFAGTLSALVSGYVAIRVLLWVLGRGHLRGFSYYCFFLGSLAIAWHLLGA